ncbi:MAG: hypothetical protein H0X24_03280 [Ktedonobacterales bacterium]|nr:hypothetical protein [Ktedonobacterales bacterium]
MIHRAPALSISAIDWGIVQSPPPIYRPAPLWSWNETLPLDEVRQQVRELARGGLGGAFMHARIGLTTPYLGEEYMGAVRAAVEEAARLGLHMYLYDEDRWPSGWGGGQVPLRDERFRVKWLFRAAPGADPPAGNHLTPLHRDADGTRYYRVVSPLGHPNFSGTAYADLMDRDAMQAFLEVAYEPFARAVGDYFGNVIPAMFTDEPAITYLADLPGIPRRTLPWTDALPAQFAQDHGYDLLPHLGELFEDVGTYTATRTDYYRTCAGLFERNYTQQLAEWCRAHGLAFTGHYMGEHSLAFTLAWDVTTLPHYRHEDWPGIDHLGLQVQEVITPIGCRSVVNQYAKPRMMSELYGTAGQHLTFADRKWIAEQQIVLGVNFLVPHLALFTMSGERKRDYPANLFYQQPWWPQNHVIDDYLSRLCALMSQGQMVPEFLVLHPQESLYPLRRPPQPDAGDWAFHDARDTERIAAIDDAFQSLSRTLLDRQRSFDYGDEVILAEVGAVVANGPRPLLCVGAMTYPLVLLPALTTLRATTLDLLAAFAAAGGPILATGPLPTMVDGRPDSDGRLQRFFATAVVVVAPTDLPARLAALAPPQVCVGDGGAHPWLWQQTRVIGAQRLTMLVNLSRHAVVADTLALDGVGPLTRLDLTGMTQTPIRANDDPVVPFPLRLAPGESALFLAGPGTPPFAQALSLPPPTAATTLTDWQVERLDDNALPLDYAAFRCGDEPFSAPVPVLAIHQWLTERGYTGPVTLRYACTSDFAGDAGHPVTLVVEHPERCRITVNAVPVSSDGTYWRDIRWSRVPLTSHVRVGENVITLAYDDFHPGDMANYADAAARYGTELEAIYLIGDFSVPVVSQGVQADTLPLAPALPWHLHVLEPANHIVPPQPLQMGDLVPQGLPFYAGRVSYRTTFAVPDAATHAVTLTLPELHVPVAEVWVNGVRCGAVAWEPYRIDITQAVRAGGNRLEIILYHSLRNLLGPHHNPAGETMWTEPEVLFVGPHSFRPLGAAWAASLRGGEDAVAGWTPTYRVTPFGLWSEVAVRWTRA